MFISLKFTLYMRYQGKLRGQVIGLDSNRLSMADGFPESKYLMKVK
jgi:hypothetical protein